MFHRILLNLEKKIEDVKNEKNKVVKSQKFEEAASLRDTEKRLQEELEKAKARMGRRKQTQTLSDR